MRVTHTYIAHVRTYHRNSANKRYRANAQIIYIRSSTQNVNIHHISTPKCKQSKDMHQPRCYIGVHAATCPLTKYSQWLQHSYMSPSSSIHTHNYNLLDAVPAGAVIPSATH